MKKEYNFCVESVQILDGTIEAESFADAVEILMMKKGAVYDGILEASPIILNIKSLSEVGVSKKRG